MSNDDRAELQVLRRRMKRACLVLAESHERRTEEMVAVDAVVRRLAEHVPAMPMMAAAAAGGGTHA